MAVKRGDIVSRKSHGEDIFFKVVDIREGESGPVAVLKGLDYRLLADAPLEDLQPKSGLEVLRYEHELISRSSACLRRIYARRLRDSVTGLVRGGTESEEGEDAASEYFLVPGRVLHLDGDQDYLDKCLRAYQQLGLSVWGYRVPEREQAQQVGELIYRHQPDVLVLTGHDALLRGSEWHSLASYRNSQNFVAAVQAARRVAQSKDALVIFAGACQSYYEALLEAGANFASSPRRVNIHAYDPVFLIEKVAFTSVFVQVSVNEALTATITGAEGLGGVESFGRLRRGFPRSVRVTPGKTPSPGGESAEGR